MTHRRTAPGWLLGAIIVAALGTAACDPSAPNSAPDPPHELEKAALSLYSPEGLREALLSFETRLGTPIKALSLRLLPQRALLQSESASKPGLVEQYEYVDGHLLGPTEVTLKGKGDLKENLFRLRSVSLEALPALVEEASRTENGPVTMVTLRRALPHASEPRFSVSVAQGTGERVVIANRRGIVLKSAKPRGE